MSITEIDISTGKATEREPTVEESAQIADDRAVATAKRADDEVVETNRSAARSLVIGIALSSVGKDITALTAAQVRSLMAILLYQAGGLTPDGKVKPLGQWAK